MTQALRQLAEDFLSALCFFVVYLITGSLTAGVGLAVALGLAQVLRLRGQRRAIDPMQWLSLALVVVLGGATLVMHSPRLMMLKPSVAHFAVAAIMLRRGWMRRYLPPIALLHVGEPVIVVAGYAWAGLMAGLGVANIIVAMEADITTWAWFISFGAIGAKAVALGLQYAGFRAIVVRRLRTARRADGGAIGPAYSPAMTE